MFFNEIHTRIRYVFLVILICLIITISRVFYVQVFQYQKLSNLAESLWSRELPISADRGNIIDRNGKILATNITTTSLVVIPSQIKNPEQVAKDLANIFSFNQENFD